MTKKPYILIAGAAVVALVLFATYEWFPGTREPGYTFIEAWGELGKGPGQLSRPTGVVVSDDRVFVSDSGNNRIQVFDKKGGFITQLPNKLSGGISLSRPMHLDFSRGKLYVSDYLNDRIVVFSPQGHVLGIIGSSGRGPGRFDAPAGVAVDTQGRLYVADFYNQRVQVLSPDGTFLRQLGETRRKGISSGRFNYPTDVALLPDGSLVVADAYNDRIQIFSSGGKFLRKWGGPFAMNLPGSFNGWFRTATAVAVGSGGDIFVADFYNHRIQKFSPEGRFLTSFGRLGSGPGQLQYPTDIAIDQSGYVYVADFGNNRIQVFRPIIVALRPRFEDFHKYVRYHMVSTCQP